MLADFESLCSRLALVYIFGPGSVSATTLVCFCYYFSLVMLMNTAKIMPAMLRKRTIFTMLKSPTTPKGWMLRCYCFARWSMTCVCQRGCAVHKTRTRARGGWKCPSQHPHASHAQHPGGICYIRLVMPMTMPKIILAMLLNYITWYEVYYFRYAQSVQLCHNNLCLPPTVVVTQIRCHTAASSPPSPLRFVPFIFTARRLQPFSPSSTSAELRLPTLFRRFFSSCPCSFLQINSKYHHRGIRVTKTNASVAAFEGNHY